jgi:phosphoglycerol transferase MdoB-like AlkP superfamily enzyme
MKLKLDRQKLRDTRQTPWLALDLAMVFLVVLNLLFIVFDTLYGTQAFRSFLAGLAPDFADWYGARIHPDFLFYDLVFITIFLAVFVFEWKESLARREANAARMPT